MDITYTEAAPDAADFFELFDTAGWNGTRQISAATLYNALDNSWCAVWGYDAGRLVGGGRVVSDGVLYATIHDLIVQPAYQRKGIGSEILSRLVQRCRDAPIRYVQLFAAAGMTDFYQRRGFAVRALDAPGMQLKSE